MRSKYTHVVWSRLIRSLSCCCCCWWWCCCWFCCWFWPPNTIRYWTICEFGCKCDRAPFWQFAHSVMSNTLPSINARYFHRKPNRVVSAQMSPYTEHARDNVIILVYRSNCGTEFSQLLTSRAVWRILHVLHWRAAKCGRPVGFRGCRKPQLLHL